MIDSCQRVFDVVMTTTLLSVAACELAADAGSCHDYTDKWFYDAQSKTCEQFSYGGCEGNENRFSSQAECERTCLLERKLQQQGANCLPNAACLHETARHSYTLQKVQEFQYNPPSLGPSGAQ